MFTGKVLVLAYAAGIGSGIYIAQNYNVPRIDQVTARFQLTA